MERELLLLGILRQQDMHGYKLNEFINRDMAFCTDLKKPTAYFLLKKMAEAGWISQETEREANRPPRRVYTLTEAGEAEFQRMLRENLQSHTPAPFADDVGLAFLDALEPAEALALLAERRAALVESLEGVQHVPHHSGTLQLLIDHQKHHLTAEIAWLDQVIAQVRDNT